MADLHEVLFQWPHSEPTNVILTGSFDQWSRSMLLTKGPAGFKGSVKLPWNVKIAYKFIVDGQWMLVEHEPTEPDHDGNVNNVYTAPPKPPPHASETDPVVVTGARHRDPTSEPEAASETPPKMITDLAHSVVAHEDTASASVGTDPINAEKITIPSPNPDVLSGAVEEQVSAPAPSGATPEVPAAAAHVTVSENTTTVDPTSGEETIGAVAEIPPTHAAVSGAPSAVGVNEPTPVTTSPALKPTTEPIIDPPASPSEIQKSDAPVTAAEVPQPEIPVAVPANGTSVPKPDSGSDNQGVSTAVTAVTGLGTEQANASQPTNEPQTNGPLSVVPEDATKASAPSAPTTPAKKAHQRFPSSSSSSSPRSFTSNVGTAEIRKRKSSFFQKLKHLFAHDKGKDKDKGGKK